MSHVSQGKQRYMVKLWSKQTEEQPPNETTLAAEHYITKFGIFLTKSLKCFENRGNVTSPFISNQQLQTITCFTFSRLSTKLMNGDAYCL